MKFQIKFIFLQTHPRAGKAGHMLSFTHQPFTELLPCARHSAKRWGHKPEYNRDPSSKTLQSIGSWGCNIKKSVTMVQGHVRRMHGARGDPRETHAAHTGRVRGESLEVVLLKLNLQNEQGLVRQRRETAVHVKT